MFLLVGIRIRFPWKWLVCFFKYVSVGGVFVIQIRRQCQNNSPRVWILIFDAANVFFLLVMMTPYYNICCSISNWRRGSCFAQNYNKMWVVGSKKVHGFIYYSCFIDILLYLLGFKSLRGIGEEATCVEGNGQGVSCLSIALYKK